MPLGSNLKETDSRGKAYDFTLVHMGGLRPFGLQYFEKDGMETIIKDADTLVFANGYHVDSAMEDMLKAADVVYHLIGDGAKVGNIKDAISGAYEIARAL